MDDYNQWPEYEACTRIFRTQRACNQHMYDTNHWPPRTSNARPTPRSFALRTQPTSI
ncbi:hypothetical protein B0J12DRAFT_690089 [Macrophomina phaseolina]|uniref:Uncharacterized protein n=1 Tax=Macrophomina phaseolina TaxID=35725 RepID=A0ABQ8FQN6_9PEZI|nr:hypothetical protein B0J12DRAFT_690853 [Macrophomina phaseolina]KAH7012407.1 hypothetical protein B0J12DRAFT_690089 [Macrophomina phaseolina]